MSKSASSGIKLFVSYSHKDEAHREGLEAHFSMLLRKEKISVWNDRRILPGADIDSEIDKNLRDADIVLLLVSPDFIKSDYCFSKEMALALDRHEEGRTIVIPIIIRPTDWSDAPFSRIKALPRDGSPVTKWPTTDDAWLNVVEEIKPLIDDFLEKKRRSLSQDNGIRPITVKDHLRVEINRIERTITSDRHCSGLSTGIESLDEIADGVHVGELILIAGRPLSGKTALQIQMVKSICVEQGISCLYLSQRHSALALIQRVISCISGIPINTLLRSMFAEDDWSRLTHAISTLSDAPLWIDDNPVESIEDIFATIRAMHLEHKLSVVIVDGLEHIRRLDYSIDSFAHEAGVRLLSLARELKIIILVSCNTSRINESRSNKRPIIADLQQWRHIADYASLVLLSHREKIFSPDSDDDLEVYIAKNPRGPSSSLRLTYNSFTDAIEL